MAQISRRRILGAAGIGLVGLGAIAARPGRHGAPHDAYYSGVAKALQQAGIATPTLVIDRKRLHANVQQIVKNIGGRMQMRVVAKSLPSIALIKDVLAQAKTDRLMVFSLPQLLQLAPAYRNILLGKPMPVAAAAAFYREQPAPVAGQTLQWLIDSPERLAQYRDLARQQQRDLAVNFEIDVGLHRGGIDSAETMQEMLAILQSEPRLRWSGLMGYDAHVTKIPNIAGATQRAMDHARQAYAAYAQQAQSALGEAAKTATYNAAGSPTYRLYDGSGVENELSIGSAMVKGTDFDTPLLDDLLPATFIATPVLKTPPKFRIPYGVEWIGDAARVWDRNLERAYFIYGGNWLADPVSPAGLAASGLYGTSSNQMVLVGSGLQELKVDDVVFFRPRQSEAVLQQFGDIAVFEDGKITDFWKPMQATA
jgi:D-serine deaminase-like pyridoxal phosphate-dependent protein